MSCNFWAVMFSFLFIINKTFKVIAVLLIKTQQTGPKITHHCSVNHNPIVTLLRQMIQYAPINITE